MSALHDQMVAALGLDYSATFVPWSKSRHAKPKPQLSDYNLNWVISLQRNGVLLQTDYMQGIAHIPSYDKIKRPHLVYVFDALAQTCEIGNYQSNYEYEGGLLNPLTKPLPQPDLVGVLYCLINDADAINYASFEDWAGSMGYDSDSRAGELAYRACLETGLKLRRMLGDATLVELTGAFRDY